MAALTSAKQLLRARSAAALTTPLEASKHLLRIHQRYEGTQVLKLESGVVGPLNTHMQHLVADKGSDHRIVSSGLSLT